MKKTLILTAALVSAAASLSAEGLYPVAIDSLSYDRHGEFMVVDMDIDLSKTKVKGSRAQVLTPLIVSAKGDTLQLPSVGVYGRQRYIYSQRNDDLGLSHGEEKIFEQSQRPASYSYTASVPFESWMEPSELLIRRRLYGCTNCLIDEKTDPVGSYVIVEAPRPQITHFEARDTGPIVETLEGAAYIDFVVDKTDINPDYRRNPQELLKIQASIDTVLNDKDVKITGVWLKGFASPESPYSHNRDLAIGRTEALKEHIRQLYNFPSEIITTDFEPEDWEGLRKFVVESNIDHKDEILEIIDSDMQPDPKEALIKKKFPKEYKFMLTTFYPALRHTEYRVIYEVNRFDDVNKIREVMRTKPHRLTLREFYILAESCIPGSDEYNEVYETAARLYPKDPVANVNAANAALQRKDFTTAEMYLSRAGDSKEAKYAKAALYFAKEEYDAAAAILKELPDMPQAKSMLGDIEGIRTYVQQKYQTILLE